VDFGLKAAKSYAQPKRYGTIEFDAIISKPIRDFPLEETTITTVYTVTNAVLAPSTALDLSGVPPQQLKLFSIH